MTGSIVVLGVSATIVAGWLVFRLARLRRHGRAGFGIDSEDRRLRHDPRFADAWVRQLDTKTTPGGSDGPPVPPPARGME